MGNHGAAGVSSEHGRSSLIFYLSIKRSTILYRKQNMFLHNKIG